jgi:uncharacterized protein (TIGR02246 family)
MTTRTTIVVVGLTTLALGGSYLAANARPRLFRGFGQAPPAQAQPVQVQTTPVQTAQAQPAKAKQSAAKQSGAQQPTKAQAAQEKASQDVLDGAKRFMEAYNRHDAKAIAALVTEDCEFIERDGSTLRGRDEIEKEFSEAFKDNPKSRISLSLDSIRLLTPDVAIEHGTTVQFPDGATATVGTKYEVTHVKQGDRWLVAHGRSYDADILTPYEYLRDLEWLVGDWVDEGQDSVVETSYRWTDNKAFLLQDFTVRVKGQKVVSGSQRIGWDPLTKHIKAWVFDSDGGYGESLWSSVDDSWVIKAKVVRPDGKVVTATNQMTRTGADRMAYQSVDRIVGDERMPNLAVTVVRKAPAPKR